MAESKGEKISTKRSLIARVLTPLGLFAAGYLAGHFYVKPRRYAGTLFDRTLRRLLFQSKPETEVTVEQPATALVGQLFNSLYRRLLAHNILSIAAAAAFFVVLAIFPGLAALISLYGLVGNTADIGYFINSMRDIVPIDVVQLFDQFYQDVANRPRANIGTFALGLLIALWSAMSGMKALIEALNVVYDRPEERSILKINVIGALMTIAFIGFMAVAVNIMLLPEVAPWLRPFFGDTVVALRWLVLMIAVLILISALYYFAPCGRQERWRIMTAGATLAATLWIAISMLFSLYLTNFANYSVTYGSLGAAAIFMTWLWLTITTLLFGAEVDAAVESLGEMPRLSEAS